jgi:hypothetical protein
MTVLGHQTTCQDRTGLFQVTDIGISCRHPRRKLSVGSQFVSRHLQAITDQLFLLWLPAMSLMANGPVNPTVDGTA